VRVNIETFDAITKDPEWLKVLVKKEDGLYIDLEAYSKRKTYLPINVGTQPYIEGFLFVKKLWDDRYRTPDHCVKLELMPAPDGNDGEGV
jgi:hypothetical protein